MLSTTTDVAVRHAVRALPPPNTTNGLRLDAAIARRRSVRSWRPGPLTDRELGQLLWAAQGIGEGGQRTVPSAGGMHAIVLHVVTEDGIDRYLPREHALRRVVDADHREALAHACVEQDFVGRAPAVLVFANDRRRSRAKYGARADRYALLEAGHAAQNVLLEAVSLGLGGVPVGAFYDLEVRREAGFKSDESPLYVVPVGRDKPQPR